MIDSDMSELQIFLKQFLYNLSTMNPSDMDFKRNATKKYLPYFAWLISINKSQWQKNNGRNQDLIL